VSSAYSWLPGTGLNRMPRKATPIGTTVVPSIIIAVQMTLIEVAAIAVMPPKTAPVNKPLSLE